MQFLNMEGHVNVHEEARGVPWGIPRVSPVLVEARYRLSDSIPSQLTSTKVEGEHVIVSLHLWSQIKRRKLHTHHLLELATQ